jgi:hypothetical protein
VTAPPVPVRLPRRIVLLVDGVAWALVLPEAAALLAAVDQFRARLARTLDAPSTAQPARDEIRAQLRHVGRIESMLVAEHVNEPPDLALRRAELLGRLDPPAPRRRRRGKRHTDRIASAHSGAEETA